MSVPPESIEVGQCFLFRGEVIRRVVSIMPNGDMQYELRGPRPLKGWRADKGRLSAFASAAIKAVPCDYEPGSEGYEPETR
jgi:hypothetical protein